MFTPSPHSHVAVTDRERFVAAIAAEAQDLSHALDHVVDPALAITYLEALALRVEAWRIERLDLIRAYVAYRVPRRLWKTRVALGERRRCLDLDRDMAVRHATRWLRPTWAHKAPHDAVPQPLASSTKLPSATGGGRTG